MRETLVHTDDFFFIGLSVRTSNREGEAAAALGRLWETFYTQHIAARIPDPEGPEIYAVYTDYERNYTGPYTALIGLRVKSLAVVPEGMTGRIFTGGKYLKFDLPDAGVPAITAAWEEIWKRDATLNRRYTADFEVYRTSPESGQTQAAVFIAVS